jgi:hypothetical protein
MTDDEKPQDLRGGIRGWLGFVLGPIIGAVLLFGGLIWQAAKYPDRGEFNDAKKAIQEMRETQIRTTAAVESIQGSLQRMEAKQDKGIEQKLDALVRRSTRDR